MFSADDHIPDLVYDIARSVKTPFYSIDVAANTAGTLRLIEIGDGQVSDSKEWPVEKLVDAFRLRHLANCGILQGARRQGTARSCKAEVR
ncbi:ATP-grasp domain-containing protein [Entomohabitans teleogrylli]|uniref:ATP-grasp domain-containing protein n=1 Tax=Entomohabitans teleogrylli TaxID=1384589 RepID=UPI00073D5E0E|nr:ATP-grasp domain-containing protein [Entomohabitans teleogrylli]